MTPAETAMRDRLAARPDDVAAWFDLAGLAAEQGRHDQARTLLVVAAALAPTAAAIWANLADAHQRRRAFGAARTAATRATQLDPDLAEGWLNLAAATHALEDHRAALAAAYRALGCRPVWADGWVGRANALRDLGDWQRAVAGFRAAIACDPATVGGWTGLGAIAGDRCEPGPARHAHDRALLADPQAAEARWNRGFAALLEGDYETGFADMEARWRRADFAAEARLVNRPLWTGDDPAGRTILVHAEQGLGDSIQMARYLPLLAARGARVVVEMPATLVKLIGSIPNLDVRPVGAPLGDFDAHCPAMSLPLAFRTRIDTVPNTVPYLRVDDHAVAAWRARLPAARRRIGVCWAGAPRLHNVRHRGVPFDLLRPLFDLPDIAWVSLQLGSRAPEAQGSPLIDLTAGFGDFADTAALIAALDAVVTVDTSIAHCTGALARPGHVLLGYATEWRWGLAGTATPWYPTLTLHRQTLPGDWSGAIAAAIAALQ